MRLVVKRQRSGEFNVVITVGCVVLQILSANAFKKIKVNLICVG
jgi:hypothetical protein